MDRDDVLFIVTSITLFFLIYYIILFIFDSKLNEFFVFDCVRIEGYNTTLNNNIHVWLGKWTCNNSITTPASFNIVFPDGTCDIYILDPSHYKRALSTEVCNCEIRRKLPFGKENMVVLSAVDAYCSLRSYFV